MINCCSLNQVEYSVKNFAKNGNIQNNENIIETENSIFQETENSNSDVNIEDIETQDTEIANISSTEELREEFESYKEEQGIFGKAIDGIANAFPFLSKIGVSGSNEMEGKKQNRNLQNIKRKMIEQKKLFLIVQPY